MIEKLQRLINNPKDLPAFIEEAHENAVNESAIIEQLKKLSAHQKYKKLILEWGLSRDKYVGPDTNIYSLAVDQKKQIQELNKLKKSLSSRTREDLISELASYKLGYQFAKASHDANRDGNFLLLKYLVKTESKKIKDGKKRNAPTKEKDSANIKIMEQALKQLRSELKKDLTSEDFGRFIELVEGIHENPLYRKATRKSKEFKEDMKEKTSEQIKKDIDYIRTKGWSQRLRTFWTDRTGLKAIKKRISSSHKQ
jgi:hypothetical protein